MDYSQRHSGFTLIELSIVLVIIGLIAGGILFGRDLIAAAEIRAQIKQFEQYNLAVNAFRTKFNCIPGDCATAVDVGLGTPGGDGDNGSGNGQIEANMNEFARGPELSNFWYHLSQAHMIDGTFPVGNVPGVNSPPVKLSSINGGVGAAINTRAGMWLSAGRADVNPMPNPIPMRSFLIAASTQALTSMAPYTPAQAHALDVKMDDGFPLSGTMTVLTNSWGNCIAGSCSNAPLATTSVYGNKACLDNSVTPMVYNIKAKDFDIFARLYLLCAPQLKIQF